MESNGIHQTSSGKSDECASRDSPSTSATCRHLEFSQGTLSSFRSGRQRTPADFLSPAVVVQGQSDLFVDSRFSNQVEKTISLGKSDYS